MYGGRSYAVKPVISAVLQRCASHALTDVQGCEKVAPLVPILPSLSLRPRVRFAASLAFVTFVAFVALSSLVSREARAQSGAVAPSDDGVYGRLSRDTVFVLEAGGGVAFTPNTDSVRPSFNGTFRVRALDTIGLFASYQNAPGASRYDALGLGLDLRILTLGRIFSDLERGPRTLDLWLDSIGLELGAAWTQPGAPLHQGSGVGLWLGGGMELPLYWNSGDAFCLRLQGRWTHSSAFDGLASSAGQDDSFTLSANLVVRLMAHTGHVGGRGRHVQIGR